jgi:hypothetical protein
MCWSMRGAKSGKRKPVKLSSVVPSIEPVDPGSVKVISQRPLQGFPGKAHSSKYSNNANLVMTLEDYCNQGVALSRFRHRYSYFCFQEMLHGCSHIWTRVAVSRGWYELGTHTCFGSKHQTWVLESYH